MGTKLTSTIIASALCLGSTSSAYSSDNICPTSEERAKVLEFYGETQKPLPLFGARKLGITEANIATSLSGLHTVASDPEVFPELWGYYTDLERSFF